MVNLVPGLGARTTEAASRTCPLQVAGGGSGVGIAGPIDGILDIAASAGRWKPRKSSERPEERSRSRPSTRVGAGCAVGLRAQGQSDRGDLARRARGDLRRQADRSTSGRSWVCRTLPGSVSDTIVRVGRQNSSGHLRLLPRGRPRHASASTSWVPIDQSGSKDVVALVGRTPCAIGYSGWRYITPAVKALKVSKKKGEAGDVTDR